MDKMELLSDLFDQKIISILKIFISNPNKQFYLKEVSDSVNVAMASTHRILRKLTNLEVITETSISKFKVYQLTQNEKVQFLRSFIKDSPKVMELFINQVKEFPGIKRIILHGKDTEGKANILLIGDNIDVARIKMIVADLKEEYKYHISYMSLTEEQFEQMSSMGLYSGQKRILFDK